ncbi:hypothetical protein P175DRAFT_0534201 [Aspergillus ochraceoroseus IBT 24754]|uniref:Uncharacterized protein n=1 Tax=Aspergillus ochraceoroseus IBT 24754 TaxID=1392256 RepID=A0A2T5LQ91_9EURO|nr:uncharacterized protein P175DRAFT_0534201 [Aspergillus ochraceoroseus IBT 24754]PTU18462.1 hypothetical protein P175DRAFT_0534201 [Aspergillus ochraceoroseus IBT 24754]
MDFDHLAKELSDRIFQVWIHNLPRNSLEDLAGKLASCHYPALSRVVARYEKVEDEVAIMSYVAQRTTMQFQTKPTVGRNTLREIPREQLQWAFPAEFTYAAPVEFTHAAWWLLLERPEDWEPDLDQF